MSQVAQTTVLAVLCNGTDTTAELVPDVSLNRHKEQSSAGVNRLFCDSVDCSRSCVRCAMTQALSN